MTEISDYMCETCKHKNSNSLLDENFLHSPCRNCKINPSARLQNNYESDGSISGNIRKHMSDAFNNQKTYLSEGELDPRD